MSPEATPEILFLAPYRCRGGKCIFFVPFLNQWVYARRLDRLQLLVVQTLALGHFFRCQLRSARHKILLLLARGVVSDFVKVAARALVEGEGAFQVIGIEEVLQLAILGLVEHIVVFLRTTFQLGLRQIVVSGGLLRGAVREQVALLGRVLE